LESIGERIRAARKDAGFNQAALAARIGVSQPAVASWESGQHDPRRLMLVRIAEALGVSVGWLAGGARSEIERDKHPAAAYLRRPVQHAPVISLRNALLFCDEEAPDPHALAEDYIPVTAGAGKFFAVFIEDDAVDLSFPKDSLAVIDYADKRPVDGAFCIVARAGENAPVLRRFRNAPRRLERHSLRIGNDAEPLGEDARIIGCVRVMIKVL
jgi:transcriptional regulator with XRE-family HTH domain